MAAPAVGAVAAPSRNLVLCLDGTSNQFSAENTNVIKLFSVLDISPGIASDGQMAYYDSGVGTYLPVGASSTWSHPQQAWAKGLDLAVAWNFGDHVKNAYQWLMDYYQPGDKIFLFGFSRGAYAVRALAGMIEKVGLLPAGNYSQIPLAYDVYKSPAAVRRQGQFVVPMADLAAKYRWIFGISREVNVHFIGVWDTVSSLGGLSAPDLPFANAVRMVTYFRQALALDERRVKFQPEFRQNNPNDGLDPIDHIARNKEVWFLGVHSSVGGSDAPDDGPSLSNVPFRWMLWEAVQCGLRTGPVSMLRSYALMSIPTVRNYLQNSVPAVFNLLGGDTVLQSPAPVVSAFIRHHFLDDHRREVIERAAKYDTTLSVVQAEADAGLPMTDDLKCKKQESLTGAYVPMDYLPLGLQSRRYVPSGAGMYVLERGRLWPHAGDGRYIQLDQKIHFSVFKRLLFDQAFVAGTIPNQLPGHPVGHELYPHIRAHLPPAAALGIAPPGFPMGGWPALMIPAARNLVIWEIS